MHLLGSALRTSVGHPKPITFLLSSKWKLISLPGLYPSSRLHHRNRAQETGRNTRQDLTSQSRALGSMKKRTHL